MISSRPTRTVLRAASYLRPSLFGRELLSPSMQTSTSRSLSPQSPPYGHSHCHHFSSDGSTNDPLGTITTATESIQSFTLRLKDLSKTIRQDVKLSSGQSVTLRDIVLHSRDAPAEDFASPAAVSARAEIQPLASQVEVEMTSMSQDFMSNVAPLMSKAASICQETPCGGATWEMDFTKSVQEEIIGENTPCGRLAKASQEFVELTHETRQEVALGSRAAVLLRMAEEHNAPLVEVRKSEQGKEDMAKRFSAGMIPTPWIRPKEEYEQLRRMKEGL